MAGITFERHALISGYLAQVPQYANGVLQKMTAINCASVEQALVEMFTVVNPVVGTWSFWSTQVQRANHNPLGEIYLVRSGSLVSVLASLKLRGAYA